MKRIWRAAFLLSAVGLLTLVRPQALSVSAGPLQQAEEEVLSYPALEEAIEAAGEWLVANHQNDDGGYSSFSAGANLADSDVGGTLDAILALAAAGMDVTEPMAYLRANADQLIAFAAQDGGAAGKVNLAFELTAQDSFEVTGHDFAIDLDRHFSEAGDYNVTNAFNQSLAILGQAGATGLIPEKATEWLKGLQATDGPYAGSWDDGFGTAGNPDATAMAIMALYKAGARPGDPALDSAVEFLAETQLASGGWEYGQGFGESANSTALVLEALARIGEDVGSESGKWAKDGRSPLEALLAWQSPSGAFQADLGEGRSDNFFATVQALLALAAADQSGARGPGDGLAIASGDSPLPYWIIGATVVLVAAAATWYLRGGRR